MAGMLAASQPAAPDSHRWYYRGSGCMCGPLTTEELLQHAESGRLTRQAEVRLDETGEWIPAASLEGLFQQTSKADTSCPQPHPPARTELSRLVQECRMYLDKRHLERCGRSAPRIHAPVARVTDLLLAVFSTLGTYFSALGSAAQGVSSALLSVGEAVFRSTPRCLASLTIVRRIASSRITWVLAIGGILAAAASYAYDIATRRSRQLATVEQLAADFDLLRNRSADDAAWDEFTRSARSTLDKLIPQLESAASAGDRASIDLLWAARDYLPQMLADARDGPSDAERAFRVCVRRVRHQSRLSGDPSLAGGWEKR